jgi:hypothetical protein
MPESPEIVELRREVAALSAVVAALFATTCNQNHLGEPDRLLDHAARIASDGGADPQTVRRVAERIAAQAATAVNAPSGRVQS